MVYLPPGHGGYIPFIEIPCERAIGETLQWILTLSLSPLACPFVPWLCCPFEIEETKVTVNNDLSCEDTQAVYASTTFWTMQAVAVVGLFVALANLANCTATLATGTPIKQEGSLVALALDLPEVTQDILSSLNLKEIRDEGKLTFITKKVMHILQEKYLKGLEKQRLQKLQEEATQSREESPLKGENATLPKDLPLSRRRRQVDDVDITTLQGFVPGVDQRPVDNCERDEVLVGYDECYQLLSEGPCEDDEMVLMDPYTRKGYCAPRLCAPDRVFVFSDQLCHDPYDTEVCSKGRRLFTNSFGVPVCGCPDGTYEEDDDLDEDVCEPILTHISDCRKDEVFWFSDFRHPPQCVPDPCRGINLARSPYDLPYVPSLQDGRCYEIGTRPPICSMDQFYSVSMDLLKGVCSTLEEAGYLELDEEELEYFMTFYSKLIAKEEAAKLYSKKSKSTPASTVLLPQRTPMIGDPVIAWDKAMPPALYMGQSVMDEHDPANNELDEDLVAILPTHMNAFSPPYIAVNRSSVLFGFASRLAQYMLQQQKQQHRHHRERRAPLPFASPANIVEPKLAACRAGARRDGNGKCRNTILLNKTPSSRRRRAVPPVPPSPSCPNGGARNVRRGCIIVNPSALG